MKREIIELLLALVLVISLGLAIALPMSTPVLAATLTIYPNGPGNYTNISGQYPNSGAHWDKVDEAVPDDDQTYVYTNSDTQQKDAYTLQDVSGTGIIASVTVYFRFRSSASTSNYAYCQPFLRLGARETAGTEVSTRSTTWTTYSQTLARPGGGNWSWSDINNLEVCIGLRHTSALPNRYAQCTQVYVVVNYNNAPTDISLSPNTIAENQPVNTVVGTFNSTDPDPGDTFTYTLVPGSGSEDNSYFNIQGNNLRTSAVFDYETKNSYSIRVRSTDQGGLWVEKQFSIAVLNVNEAPTANPQSGLVVNSCDTLTVTLSGSDPEDDPLSYKISALPIYGELYDGISGIKITSVPFILTSNNVTYKPSEPYSGPDSFDFKANDGEFDSTEATVSVTVTDGRTTWYRDADNDGYGDPDDSTLACIQPEGYVGNAGDGCPEDPNKTEPGICGCGTPDTDSDNDGTPDCEEMPIGCTLTIFSTEGGSVIEPGEGVFTYAKDTVVNIVAIPDKGYRFVGWTGDVSTIIDTRAAAATITVNNNCTILANFRKVLPTSNPGSNSGGGCFIATAAYGTPTAEEINVLREFRDKVLLKNTLGSRFVALYYRFSPPIADFISEYEFLRTLVRELLIDPIVWVVETTGNTWRN